MSNLFAALDLSDDENITVVKPAEPKGEKKHHVTKGEPKLQLPRKELQAQEEALKQQKKGPAGQRGSVPQPDVAHPGERSKSGVKKEQKPATHKQPEDGERRGRQFDRHSGTGRGREIKKGGGGGRNWGKPGDEQAPLPEGSPEPEAAAQTEAGAEPESTAPAVQEDPSLTFEEYERLRAAKRVGEAFQEKEARKVSTKIEGVAYKKDDNKGEGDYVVLGADEEHELKKKPGHFKHKQKEILEFDLKFRETTVDAPPRRGGREGGRGGSRSPRDGDRPERSERPDRPSGDRPPRGGGAPRGAGPRRGGAPGGGSARIDTADQSAFPKLGGSA